MTPSFFMGQTKVKNLFGATSLLVSLLAGADSLAHAADAAPHQLVLLVSLLAGADSLAHAADAAPHQLVMALSTTPDSLDPYHHNLAPNLTISHHIYDTLVDLDERQHPVPGLAESWKATGPDTWEFKLRKGVTFHDGSTFDANDVLASWARVPTVHGPSSFTVYTEVVKEIKVLDPYTIQLTTNGPFPLLPVYLTQVMIIPAEVQNTATADFDNGKALIGTGPYRYSEGSPGHTLTLTANPHYWGGKPAWDTVEIRFIPNDADRVTALISGTVDLINAVPPADVHRLESNPQLKLAKAVSNRVIYLSVDFDRPQTPFARDRQNTPLPTNPFQSLKVRQAISKAINRQAIIDELLYGQAVPAGQLIPDDMDGANPSLKPEPFNLPAARTLLAEAGYPKGFTTVLHGPNNRYVRDAEVASSVALMLTGAGLATTAETMPASEFFPRNKNRDFSFTLRGWSSDTGEAGYSIKALLATRDVDKGLGTANHNRYSNKSLDDLVIAADHELDAEKRRGLIQKAMADGINDLGQIPLYFQMNLWASKEAVKMTPRVDELTLARDAVPVR
ncbi:ABC transporter substrate-binding protein [Insolitispirillum peregrinum]|uniref:ABC transporter substrate-binding protein n=1 Tax=Insolitispirillum peregrinum TaxID=80876 RepID=UPI00158C5244|nr:ABC transporter substrate-binding protein [Insolitispirillum peregrinum]